MSRAATTSAPAALPAPVAERWTLLRGGIQNVWEYDDRRFVFERGRLLLRGQNEAGKTKAMELLFPFLLDADLSPQRLDPFGSVARPMYWNLLNEADPDLQSRTGYVWLELGRVDDGAPRFATLGCGLRARRGTRDVDHWFFLTSRRVDAGLDLMPERQPLARAALAGVLGGDGQVFDRGADYRRAVNELLLGMPEEQYEALIETLVQLRRPQLSKSLDLEGLSSLLSASLPPLDRGVVGPIAEGFERLDHHRAELEQRLELLGKVRGFEDVHRAHARAVAKGRAVELTRAESAYHAARAEARERAAALESARVRHAGLEGRAAELEARAQALEERTRALEGSDAYRAALDLDQAEEAARVAAGHAHEAARRMEEDGRLAEESEARRAAASADEADRAERLAGARAAAVERARAGALEGAHAAVERLAVQGEVDGAAGALAAVRRERDEVIARLRALAGALAQAREAARRAEERARERAEALETARDALRGAEAKRAEAEAAWEGAVEAWAASLRELPREDLPFAVDAAGAVTPRVFRAGVEALAEPLRRAIAEARAAAVTRRASALELAGGLRAERDGLAAAGYPALAPPPWRAPRPPDRPGAPLFLLCDFGPGAAGREAGLEAALEASGLLDAWVEPDGTVLDPLTGEAVLRAGEAVPGATLLDALVPVAAGAVSEERTRAVLASVGLAAPGEESPASVWVSADGRFRLGPLCGAHAKSAPAHVGATARERERARRIAELEGRIAAVEADAAAAGEAASAAERRADALAREVAAVPAGDAIEAARAREEVRAQALAEARARHAEAEERASAAERQAREAGAALDRAAGEAGLSAFSRDPEALAERSRAWAVSAEAMVTAARDLARARSALAREEKTLSDAKARAERSRGLAAEVGREAAGAAERARTLRETAGKERDEVLAALGHARAERREVARAREEVEREVGDAREAMGAARRGAEEAEAAVTERDGARQEAARSLCALAAAGVLAAAALDGAGRERGGEERERGGEEQAASAVPATFTATLELARDIDAAPGAATPEERERAENRLMSRANELAYQLPPDVRLVSIRPEGVLSYAFTWGGRERPAREVLHELERDVSARTALLGDEERALLEVFLSGEAHDHLAIRLREARKLVDRMNAALDRRTTSAGSQVRLAWELDEAAQEDAREAVPLFLRTGALLTERNRDALRAFLERRLALAREAVGTRPLQDRLLEVLDYRAWHRFHVEHRAPGEPWAKLTRKAHAAGSGGKKAVLLHLPLFAAAAAFYDSARPTAPRIVALDEAFAGIDRPTRGKLMGLLAEFDLDFLMTSFEEWGCYEELDGLATYHLSRAPGQRGVYAERFLWNGRERVLVEES
jgi:uncharacterized protein (TIGR02680 family)